MDDLFVHYGRRLGGFGGCASSAANRVVEVAGRCGGGKEHAVVFASYFAAVGAAIEAGAEAAVVSRLSDGIGGYVGCVEGGYCGSGFRWRTDRPFEGRSPGSLVAGRRVGEQLFRGEKEGDALGCRCVRGTEGCQEGSVVDGEFTCVWCGTDGDKGRVGTSSGLSGEVCGSVSTGDGTVGSVSEVGGASSGRSAVKVEEAAVSIEVPVKKQTPGAFGKPVSVNQVRGPNWERNRLAKEEKKQKKKDSVRERRS